MVSDLVKALTDLAEASAKERIARKSYVGTDWDDEGHRFVEARLQARRAFEGALERFAEHLAGA